MQLISFLACVRTAQNSFAAKVGVPNDDIAIFCVFGHGHWKPKIRCPRVCGIIFHNFDLRWVFHALDRNLFKRFGAVIDIVVVLVEGFKLGSCTGGERERESVHELHGGAARVSALS